MAGVEELKLGVGDAAVFRIHLSGFGAITITNELDKALTGVELHAQPLA